VTLGSNPSPSATKMQVSSYVWLLTCIWR
ncbi:MAG: hypothetical protein QOJ67_1936, partial [Acidimicrobiaceae bacterium]